MMLGDILIADDDRFGAGAQRGDARAERSQKAAPNNDVIAARTERDVHGCRIAANRRGHPPLPAGAAGGWRNSSSAVMISVTIVSCGTSRDCTVRSASA